MANFLSKTFGKLTSSILNLIVIALSVISVISLIALPVLNLKVGVTFTKEISEILLPKNQETTDEDEIIQLVVDELVKEKVTLRFEIKLSAMDTVSCALDGGTEKTKEILYSFTDAIAESVDEKVIEKAEIAITKASVTTVIKMQISTLSDTLGEKSDEVMQNIGVDEEYVNSKTQSILDSIKADGANVDSVTDSIMTIVDDVDQKLQGSEYKDEVDKLTEENRAEIRDSVAELVQSLSDENGEIDGDSLISSLLSGLLSDSGEQASALPNSSATFAIKKPLFETENKPEEKSLDQILKEELRALITGGVVKTAKTVFLAISILLAIVAFCWAYLILKIFFKMHSKNPLIKLKAPISVSWIPFVILFAIPNVISILLKNPPSMLTSAIGEQGLSALTTIGKAISLSASSSTLIPFVLSVVLFVFGILYSARRKALKKELKKQKTSV
ncbi:MAG: hypothetical protein IJC87_00930 [Clostridia bacterium]|nr:hypothetical protein [Clostridia bacterium]